MVFRSLMSTALILVLTVFKANASVIYAYTGDNFTSAISPYTTDMNISLQIVTASPLAATGAMTNITSEIISYTMFDGRKTLTELDSAIDVLTNIDAATGLPVDWSVHVTNESGKSVGDIVNRMSTFYDSFSGGNDSAEELECAFIPPGVGECLGFSIVALADVYYSSGSSGSWSVVPIPGSVWLFGTGLFGLIGLARRTA